MTKNWIFGVAAVGALALSACAPTETVRSSAPVASTPTVVKPSGSCNVTSAGWAIGKAADSATLAKVKADSGAVDGRVIAPGQPVTKDFNAARVNVYIDSARMITRLTCG